MNFLDAVKSGQKLRPINDISQFLYLYGNLDFLSGCGIEEQKKLLLGVWEIENPPQNIEILYEVISNGEVEFLFDNGQWADFNQKKKRGIIFKDINERKTGRTLKINMDTWSIENE